MTMDNTKKDNLKKSLCELLAATSDPESISDLLDDLCTYKEIEQMAARLQAAKLLTGGSTYTQVIQETDISSATLSRVSRALQYGKGYSKLLKK